MKTLGIIGGIAPGSTIEYYRLIIDSYRAQKQDGHYPPLIINSIDLTKMLELIGSEKFIEVTEYLVDEVKKLAQAGADFGLFASNTPHIVFDEIQRQSPIRLISIVEATCDAAKELGLCTVGLLGTRFTMQGHFYMDLFTQHGIRVVAPRSDDQEFVHGKYMNELINGVFTEETREELLAIVDRMIEENAIEGLILGGTELPFILRNDTYRRIPFLDTTQLHVDRAVVDLL